MTHPNNLGWTHYVAASLPLWQRLQFNWHLRQCGICRDRALLLQQQRAAFCDSAVYRRGLAGLQARLRQRAPQRRVWPWLGSLAALGAAAWVGVAVQRPEGDLHAKGADQFALFVQHAGEAVPLGTQCQAGDSVRARYQSARGYLMVVEVDDGGQAQVVFPAQGSESARIGKQADLTPGSWVLDNTPGRERFVAVFSRRRLQSGQVLQAVRRGTPLTEADANTVEITCSKTAH